MNEKERAEWLARAIDDLLHNGRQRPNEPPPPKLDREELNALLRIASLRAEGAGSEPESGPEYEGEAWQRTLKRLDRRRFPRNVKPFEPARTVSDIEKLLAEQKLDELEMEDLHRIARMRRQMAEDAAALAEEHRDEVWKRIQERLGQKAQTRFRFRRRKDDERLAAALDLTPAGEEAETGDEELDALVDVARHRAYWSRMTREAGAESQERVWERVCASIHSRLLSRPKTRLGSWWRRPAVAAAAVAAVTIAALAPLPATGLADHPVAQAVRSFAEHVGVRETDAPPPLSSGPVRVQAATLTEAELSSLKLAVPVVAPSAVPNGFRLTSERYFPEPLTAESGGVFVLTYERADGATLAVYQERAGGADLSAQSGSAEDITLADGTPATFVQGTWREQDGALIWDATGAQTLVFERDGARTTVQYRGPEEAAASLFLLANALTAAR